MTEYMVHARGEVTKVDEERHTYIITANSQEEAALLAKNAFSEMYGSSPENITASSSMVNRNLKGWIAVILFSIAIFLSFIKWYVGDSSEATEFKPDLIGGIFATLFYGAYVIRFKAVNELFHSILDTTLFVVNILTLSGLINILLVSKNFSVLGINFPIETTYILMVAIIISWFGLKSVSGFCLIFVILLGMLNVVTLNQAMGLMGILYILSVTLGVLLYVSIEPSVIDAVPYFYRSFEKQSRWVKSDISSLQEKTTTVGKKLLKKSKRGKGKAKR